MKCARRVGPRLNFVNGIPFYPGEGETDCFLFEMAPTFLRLTSSCAAFGWYKRDFKNKASYLID